MVEANNSGTTGLLIVVQRSGTSSEVTIRGRLSTLTEGKHGIHVHTFGSTRSNCDESGGHFNPTNVS